MKKTTTVVVLFMALSFLAGILHAQSQGTSGEIVGIPWVGEKGVAESVQQIMARQESSGQEGIRARETEAKKVWPDRHNLPQNPSSRQGSQWPLGEKKSEFSGASPFSPQTVGLNFTGATLSGVNPTNAFPPDDMGAVGPTQYIIAVNGRIVSFNKTTGVADGALNVTTNTFFSSVRNASGTSDPRIRYDRLTGRWFIIIINVSTPNRVLIAVSNTGTITGSANFTFFFFLQSAVSPAGDASCLMDYPTLGIDANAMYIGGNQFCPSYNGTVAFVVQKSSVLGAGPIVVSVFRNLTGSSSGPGPYTPQGVDNYDPAATEGYIIGTDNASYGTLMLRRVSNPGGTPTLSGNISIATPLSTSNPIDVRHLGNTNEGLVTHNGRLDALDDRLFAAHFRNGRLWTAHNVGVDNTGSASGTATRNGSRWYELQGIASPATPSVVQSGTVFASSAGNTTDQRNYWIPSIMVSGQGHAAMVFSTAGTNEYANASTVGRLSGDALGTMQTPVLYTSSSTAYNPSDPGNSRPRRWGDYTYVSLDPNDDMTMWGVAQFCDATNSYGCRIVQLVAPPPATPASSTPPSVAAGLVSVNVTITGTQVSGSGFFDPGAGFTNRIAGSITGGVVVNSITYVNPTTVTLNLNTVSATTGAKNVAVTNPDGQARTGTSILTITSAGPSITVSSPNGAETWPVGTSQTITWTSSGVSGNVKIDLSTNGGSTFPTVLFGSTANDNSEVWTVAGPASSTARIRISSVADGSIRDSSNANFSIVQPTITVTAPNGGESWAIGSAQTISWSSNSVSGNVKIELSTNGGSTFPTVLFANTANDNSESWTVTGPPATNALIRISSVSNPSVIDVSNGQFTIREIFSLLTKLRLRDNGGELDSLEYGTGAGATDGIDTPFGEYEQPPLPPTGVFDVRWSVAGTQGSRRDVRDTLGGTRQQVIYTGKLQAGEGGYPFVVKWNRQELPAGTFTLRDGPSAFFFSVNMKQQDSLVISDEAVVQFQLVYDGGNTVYGSAQSGWNVVSVPVTVGDRRKTVVFPTSTSSAFAYTASGYVNRDTLEYGVGYWLKFPSAQALSVSGGLISTDTIDVIQGWNIIGSISSSVPVGNIVQIPVGIVVSPYFAYGSTGYGSATSIDPMRGYWVKVSQNGRLVLSGSAARPKGTPTVRQLFETRRQRSPKQ